MVHCQCNIDVDIIRITQSTQNITLTIKRIEQGPGIKNLGMRLFITLFVFCQFTQADTLTEGAAFQVEVFNLTS